MVVEAKMSVPQVIHQIDEVIRDTYTSRKKKDRKSAKPCNDMLAGSCSGGLGVFHSQITCYIT